MFKTISLDDHFNNTGVTGDNNRDKGNLTLMGTSLPLEGPFIEDEYYYDNIPFNLKKKNHNDNISLEGQQIDISSDCVKNIYFVGNSFNGNLFDYAYLIDEDNREKCKICLTDFKFDKPEFGNELFYKFSRINNDFSRFSGKLWFHKVQFEKPKKISSILFEDNPFMHVFAITVEESP